MGTAGTAVGLAPPYGPIWNDWKAGNVIPFLGAGASCFGRPEGMVWNPRTSAFLPSGSELSCLLADEASYPGTEDWERKDLAKVCSYYADSSGSGRASLRRRLRDIFNVQHQPGPLHRFLADIPGSQVIVVTNYDTLVEQAFQESNEGKGKPYDLVVYPADSKKNANSILWWPYGAKEPQFSSPKSLVIDFRKTTVIFKMHGTVNPTSDTWDHFVITEEDYVEFLARMTTKSAIPLSFYEYFRDRSFLFLGYSLKDWNLRLVLRNLSGHFAARSRAAADGENAPPTSWGIQRSTSPVERALWDRRNVKIFDCDLNEFAAGMKGIRERLGD